MPGRGREDAGAPGTAGGCSTRTGLGLLRRSHRAGHRHKTPWFSERAELPSPTADFPVPRAGDAGVAQVEGGKQRSENQKQAPCPAFPGAPGWALQPGTAGRGERGLARAQPPSVSLPRLVSHNTQTERQSTGRDLGHPRAAMGSHCPWEMQPGAHLGQTPALESGRAPRAASWGDKGSLCGSLGPWGLWQCCHGAGGGCSRTDGETPGTLLRKQRPARGREQSGCTLPAERKQMAPAQPRHFPALSGGAEQSAGSRGCGIDKILPWLCLPPSYGVFLFRTASKV